MKTYKEIKPIPEKLNDYSKKILDSAFAVHTKLGPGCLESAYETFMIHEIKKRGLQVESQVGLPIICDGISVNVGYRMDILVEKAIIVELKSVETILPVHESQIITYLKLSECRIGLLINFKTAHLKDGIKRYVN